MKKVIFFLIALITLAILQCKKASQESLLPAITTHGANTFGCLVNGNAWLPKGGWDASVHALDVEFDNNSMKGIGSILHIYANNVDYNNSNIDFEVISINGTGKYNVINNRSNAWMDYSKGNFSYSDDSTGVVGISHIDTTNKIISGTFHFHPNPDKITDGRFDVHYPLTIH